MTTRPVEPYLPTSESVSERFGTRLRRMAIWAPWVLLIAGAFVIRLIGLDKGIWLDEYYTIAPIQSAHLFEAILAHDYQPPLYFLLLKVWARGGMYEPYLRLLSVSFGLATVAFVVLWLRSYSTLSAWLGGLLCATLPILLRYSSEIRGYGLLVLVTAIAGWSTARIAAEPRRGLGYVSLAAALGVAVATHLVGVMLPPVFGLYLAGLLLSGQGEFRRLRWRALAGVAMVPVVVFVYLYFFYFWRFPNRGSWWMPELSWELIRSTAVYLAGVSTLQWPVNGLKKAAAIEYLDLSTISPFLTGIVLLILVVWGNWRRSWPLLAAALLFWLQVAVFSLLFTPIFVYRTLLPGLLPFIGFLSVQTATVRRHVARFAVIGFWLALAVLYAAGWVTHDGIGPVEPWKQVAAALVSQRQPGSLVVFYPQYTEGPVRYYATELTDEDAVVVELGTERADLSTLITAESRPSDAPAIFLVMRADAPVSKDVATRDALLSYLAATFDETPEIQEYGILSLTRYDPQLN